jgi:hypothetical protein
MTIKTTFRSHMIPAAFFMLLFMFSTHVRAQLALPLDKGLPGRVYASCTDSTNLYVMYHATTDTATFFDTCALAKWNGIFWAYYPKFVIRHSDSRKFCMAYYNGQIYVGGFYDSMIGVPNSQQIFKWNGKKYTSVGGGVKSKGTGINTMAVFKNKLYVGGNFKGIGNATIANKIAAWDTTWSYLGTASATGQGILNKPLNYSVLNITSSGSLLYVMGSFDSVATITKGSVANIATWNGAKWNTLANNYNRYVFITTATIYGTGLAVAGQDSNGTYSVSQLSGTTWTKSGAAFSTPITSLVTFNGKLWASANDIYLYDGKSWARLKAGNLNGGKLYTTSDKLFATGNFISFYSGKNIIIENYSARILVNSMYIRGKAYKDVNSNCKFDLGDIPLDNKLIKLAAFKTIIPFYTITNSDGDYSSFLTIDSVTINAIPNKYDKLTCNKSENIIGIADSIYNDINFAFETDSSIIDLKVKISPDQEARIGTAQKYSIYYENVGGKTIPAAFIQLNYDSAALPNFSSSPTYSTNTVNQVGWGISNLAPGAYGTISFKVDIPRTDSINTPLLFTLRADSLLAGKDSDMADNFDTLKQKTTNSHDPNGKTVSPEGLISKNTARLNYSVFFQNTGTAQAYKVFVVDTVDTNLPLTKVVINSASHKYSLQVKNNVLIWTFSNINLADSTSDAAHSMGHLSYTAYIKSGLAIGTVIKNKAWIYFDYNNPMRTNETVDKLGIITGVAENNYINNTTKIYPNPSSNQLIIENSSAGPKTYTLINSTGQTLEILKLYPWENYKLNTESFKPGLYIIRTESGESFKLVIRH